MKITAVIGANYGDEGKGRLVDYIVSKSIGKTIVVRYNGGAQAAHTVVCPDGKSHKFSHFGSGSFLNAPTYLSKFFIGNPILFIKELKDLKDINVETKVYVHPYMPLSTPYDMLLNREIEIWRGDDRHGSCGYGIAETVERLCNSNYKTFLTDAINKKTRFQSVIEQIKKKYVPARLKQHQIKIPTDSFVRAWKSDNLLNTYYRSLLAMIQSVKVHKTQFLSKFDNLVFEGAQGLGLDERHKNFPHVTRSKTGLDNINQICERINVKEIDVIYVTRSYLTRHGAGPLQTESEYLYYKDDSNVENEWQGKLRFGYLDINMLSENINNDVKENNLKINKMVAVTCLDQIPEKVKIRVDGELREIKKTNLPVVIQEAVGNVSKIITSSSPKRQK